MKKCFSFALAIMLALLAAGQAPAANVTWDANGATGGQTDGAGVWLNANQWWNGTTNVTWTSGDAASFGFGGAGGAVTLASPTTVDSLTFNYFTGTYTLGTAGQAITLNSGITMNPTGSVVVASPLVLGGSQTWLNSKPDTTSVTSAGSLRTSSTIDNGGNTLTIDGVGTTQITGILSGGGGFVKNGLGTLVLREATHTYTGATVINGGVVRISGNDSFGTGTSLTINDGVVEGYFGGTFARSLGTGAGQIQILGGTSGFSGQGSAGTTFNIGTLGSTLQWGSTYFDPVVFVLQASTVNTNGAMVLNNAIDLNGATRTIASLGGNTTGGATVNYAITGTGAGLIKIGSGNLILTANNTYDGATTITGANVPSAPTTYSGAITLSGAAGRISATSGLTLNGGSLQMINGTTQTAVDRFANGAGITSNGGGIVWTNTSGNSIVYAESLGSVGLASSQLNVVLSTNQTGTGTSAQTLTLAGLTRSGASNTSAVTFSAATTGPQASGNKNMIVVTAAGTTSGWTDGAASNSIIGPWATVGTTAALQRGLCSCRQYGGLCGNHMDRLHEGLHHQRRRDGHLDGQSHHDRPS